MADQSDAARVRRGAGRRGRAVEHRAATARRQGAARSPPRGPADPGELPHRHADGVHDGADAVGAAPGGVPGRPRRRRVPAPGRHRRRRRAGPQPRDRRARQPLRGPATAARRGRGGHREAGDHLHRRQRLLRSAAAARGAAGRAARRPGRHDAAAASATRSSCIIRCSRSTFATSCPASWCPTCRSPSTRRCCRRRRPAPASAPSSRSSSPARCPPQPHDDVALADLVGFFKDPVKGFFRALEYTLPWDVDGVADEISVDIDALEQWAVGDRMLNDMLRGMTPDDARQAEWRRGTLPPGQLGLAQGRRTARAVRPCSPPTALALPQGRRGRLRRRHRPGCRTPADGHGVAGVRRPTGLGHLLQARRQASAGVVDSVAGVVRSPSGPGLVGGLHRPAAARRPRRASGPSGSRDEPAVDLLRDLVAIYDAGRREPLPLPIKTSYAWACARHEGGDPEREAAFRWKSGNVSRRGPGPRAGAGLGAERLAART